MAIKSGGLAWLQECSASFLLFLVSVSGQLFRNYPTPNGWPHSAKSWHWEIFLHTNISCFYSKEKDTRVSLDYFFFVSCLNPLVFKTCTHCLSAECTSEAWSLKKCNAAPHPAWQVRPCPSGTLFKTLKSTNTLHARDMYQPFPHVSLYLQTGHFLTNCCLWETVPCHFSC